MKQFHYVESKMNMGSDYNLEEGRKHFMSSLTGLGTKPWDSITKQNQERFIKKALKVPVDADVFGEGESIFRSIALTVYDYKTGYKHPFDFGNYRTFITASEDAVIEPTIIEKQGFWMGAQKKLCSPKVIFMLGETASRFMLGKEFNMKDNWGDVWFYESRLYVPIPARISLEKDPSLERDVLTYGLWFQDLISDLGFSHNWQPFGYD